jgi:peptidoglycan/LPS O-acetylase OafA/YrhL
VNVIVTRREIDPPHSTALLQSGRLSYRPDIDGLRALAILPVVLYHAGIPGFSGGFVGVDVFFVISGYLMASLIIGEIGQGNFSLLRFYERRIRRIFPALLRWSQPQP